MHNKKSITIRLLSIAFFLIGALAILVWGLNTVSQNEAVTTRFIAFQIHRLLDLDSEVIHPRAYLDWDLQYKIRADKLTFINESKDLVSVEDLHVNVFLPYMLLRKIYITNMSAQNLYADFERYENKKINIIEIFNITGFFKIYFQNSTISVNKYFFNVLDNAHKPSERMVITGNNILISKFSKNKYLQLIMDGNIDYNTTTTPFSINYNVKLKQPKEKYNLEVLLPDFDFDIFKNYTKEFAPHLDLHGKGYIRAKSSDGKYFNVDTSLHNVNCKSSQIPYSIKFKDKISLFSRFAITNKDIIIDELKIKGNDFSTSAYGKIFNPKIRPVDLILHIKIDKNSNGNSMLKIAPNGIPVLNHAIDKAKKHNVGGIAEGDIFLKGKIGYLQTDGYILINGLTLGYGNDLPKSSVRLNFNKEKMYIDGIHYPNYNRNQYVTIGGNIKITKPFFLNLQIDSTPSVDLVSTQKALNVYSNVLNFKTGPTEIMSILAGQGNINLSVKDTPPNVYLYGKMNFRNGIATYPGLHGELRNISGDINFDGKYINYKNIKGSQDGIWAYAHGQTQVHKDGLTDFYLDIPSAPLDMAKNFIDNSPLLNKVSTGLIAIHNPKGNGTLKMVMTSNKYSKEPYVKGSVFVDNSSCDIDKLAYRAKNIFGKVDFTSEKSILDLYGHVHGIETKLTGTATPGYSQLNIITDNADIQKAYEFVYNSPMFEATKNSFNDFSDFSGTIKTKTKVNGNFATQAVSYYTEIDVINGQLKYLDFPEYINVSGGKITAQQDKIMFSNLKGQTLNSNYTLNGIVTDSGLNSEKRNLVFTINDLPVASLDKVINTKLMTTDVKKMLSKLNFQSGAIDVKSYISKEESKANIIFHDACAIYKPTNEKILIPSGEFFYSNEILKIKNLFVRMAYSDFLADGEIKNYLINPIYDIKMALNLSEEDFNKTLAPMFNLPINLVGKIYTNIDFIGNIHDWGVKFRAMLEDNSYILYHDARLGEDLSKFVFADIIGNDNDVIINTFDIFAPTYTTSSSTPDILARIKGKISNISRDFPTIDNMNVEIFDYMNISFLNILFYDPTKPQPLLSKGLIKGKVFLNGDIKNLSVLGKADVKDATIPSINSTLEEMNVDFKQDKIQINDAIINIAGSIAKINATMNSKFTTPMSIQKLKLESDLIDSDKVLQSFSSLFAKDEEDTYNLTEQPIPPFTINEGKVDIKKFIYNKLPAENFSADFNVTNNWDCSIKNFKADFKEGSLNGDIDYNFYTTDLTGNIEIKDVIANDFATGFLNLPNEIFGKLTANVNFSTKGKLHDELVENLDAMVYFTLNKGRMIRLGSIEYMLRIANTFKSGITRLNLNAILNIVAPRTGYFDVIEGDMQIQDGTILADKITFQSSELNLFLTGSYNMNNSVVNGTIIGQMPMESRESILWLGSLGKISLNSLIKQLTREVSKEQENGFLYNPLAYINDIPGLKNNRGDYRFFVVSLKGNLYEDKYVDEFKWIK